MALVICIDGIWIKWEIKAMQDKVNCSWKDWDSRFKITHSHSWETHGSGAVWWIQPYYLDLQNKEINKYPKIRQNLLVQKHALTFGQPRLIGNTCLYIHFCNTVIMYLATRFAAVSKWNVQRVALKHTFNTWPWHVFIRLVHARIAVFSLYCLRYVLPPFIIQISGECR